MQVILLSGGSGKRLWPFSNEIRAKQFLKIFQDENGNVSMLQRVLRQIEKISPDILLTISTSKNQREILRKYVGSEVRISVEPCSRSTFPAIALTASFLREKEKISPQEPLVICPVDSYVDDKFFAEFKNLANLTQTADLALLGILPSYPSEKYGYIIPASEKNFCDVLEFKEKPDAQTAAKFIEAGALWNAGVFACKLSYVLQKSREILGTDSFDRLQEIYHTLPKISFDRAVVENEKNIKIIRYHGDWKDVGTWNTLTEVMDSPSMGEVHFDSTCQNCHVLNETDTPIVAMGLKDIVVAASADGILVADKTQSGFLKPLVEKISRQIRFAEKSWGTYRVIDISPESLTIKVTLNAGHSMRYHSHAFRREVWTIIAGEGLATLNEKIFPVKTGDVIEIPRGVKHSLRAETNLQAIEVQLGKDISVEDKTVWEN